MIRGKSVIQQCNLGRPRNLKIRPRSSEEFGQSPWSVSRAWVTGGLEFGGLRCSGKVCAGVVRFTEK